MRQSKLNAQIKEAVKTNPSVTKKPIGGSRPRLIPKTHIPDRVVTPPDGRSFLIRDNDGHDMIETVIRAEPIQQIATMRDIDAQLKAVSVEKMTRTTPRAPITANYDGVVPETQFSNHHSKKGNKPASAKRSWK